MRGGRGPAVGVAEAPAHGGVALRVVRFCLPFVVAAAVVLTFFLAEVRRAAPPFTGDEPHYLVFAEALTHGTFDVRATYQESWSPVKWPSGSTPDQIVVHDGHWRSIRMPLLPLLLAPAVALGSLTLARLTMVAIAIALLDQLWRLLGDLGYRGAARAGPWLAALTAFPVLGYATHIYPEIPGAFCVVVSLRLLVRGTRRSLVAASAVAGLLPWLIIRFGVLAMALVVAAVVTGVRPASWHPRVVARAVREYPRRAAIIAAPGFASLVAVEIYLRVLYGSFDPGTVYPPGFTQPWTLWHAYVLGVGSLFGATEGFVPYAPALLIGLIGAVVAARRFGALGWFFLAVAAIHLFVIVPLGFWGLALPGRFVIVLVPLFVIAMAEAIHAVPLVNFALIAVVAVQVMLLAVYRNPMVLIVDHIPHYTYLAAFPTVEGEPGNESFGFPLAQAPGPVAHVEAGLLSADRALGAGVAYASPSIALRPGRYRAVLLLSSKPPHVDADLARLTITELPQHRVLADRTINADEIDRAIHLDFDAPHQPLRWTNRVTFEIDATGAGDFQIRSLYGAPTTKLRSRDGVIHDDVPLAAAWLAAVAVGSALVLIGQRHASRVRGRPRSTDGPEAVGLDG